MRSTYARRELHETIHLILYQQAPVLGCHDLHRELLAWGTSFQLAS